MRTAAATFIILAALHGRAFADCGDAWDALSATSLDRAKIVANIQKSHFVKSPKNEPECVKPDAKCQLPGFLVPGDEVLITDRDIAYG